MKKVFFSLAVLCSVALVSCGGNKTAETTDSETIAVEVAEETVAVPTDSESVAAPVEAVEAAPVAESAK